ncbi:Phosphopantothenoylcysteine decarboxylase / Phosphopantothenate--cysteine ligase [Azospirillaceae bacterium]
MSEFSHPVGPPSVSPSLAGKYILLIIAGGVAAYKTLDLIRRLRDAGAKTRCVLTDAGARFVTPLSVAALSGEKVFQDLWSLTDEVDIGHIRLSREADILVVAPATADLMAKMAAGLADDLASTALLASDKPILIAPSMNVYMWNHPATQSNVATLEARGVRRVGPNPGPLACGESGLGRMAEPAEILHAIAEILTDSESSVRRHSAEAAPLPLPAPFPSPFPATPDALPTALFSLTGRRVLVTSGPTYEPIDPVRFIGNRSSGRQGMAIAAALAARGAEVTLVTGPTREAAPHGVAVIHIETACEMLTACQSALPVDVAVCAAAVADWRIKAQADQKIKKGSSGAPVLELVENPDILATLSQPGPQRPPLVVGFAAETQSLVEHARAKLARKRCDWIVANDVSPHLGTFGGEYNSVCLLRANDSVEQWPTMTKIDVANRLADAIAAHFNSSASSDASVSPSS